MIKTIIIFNILITSLLFAVTAEQESFVIVSKDGTGNYLTIQEALNSIPDSGTVRTYIIIKPGLYEEKIYIEKSNIILAGESRENTILKFPELRKNWKQTHEDDYGSAVINIKKNVTDIFLKSITVINNYGELFPDHDHAFTIRSFEGTTRIILDDCSIISYGGDALSLWNTEDGMYYHSNCYFEGWVDYVCPRGYCFIENSKFYGHNMNASIWHDGSKNEDHKFIIKNSYFDGVEGFPLGRFHRDAQFFLINCKFSEKMADRKIYFAPSTPPRILQWGEERIYLYNCKVNGKVYKWLKDNLNESKDFKTAEEVTVEAVFRGKWNPYSELKEINEKLKVFN